MNTDHLYVPRDNDVIELGIASLETKGGQFHGQDGIDPQRQAMPGLSDD